MNSSTFVWLLLALELVKSEGDVKVKGFSAGARLYDLMAEYQAMDPPKDDLFNDVPNAGKALQVGMSNTVNWVLGSN